MFMTQVEPFELIALRYGHHANRTEAMNFLGGDPHDQGSALDYYVWVARRSDRVILIDTGFSQETATRRGRTLLRAPSKTLETVGIAARHIDDVVLTHLHFDHAGTLADYPQARLHVQDSEMAYVTGRCMCHTHLSDQFEAEDVVGMVRAVFAGRVWFHDGDSEIVPGLSVHRIGGHTAGLQAVRVFTRRGWVVLASDASHLYENMESVRPFPIVNNVSEMLEGYRRLHDLADSVHHIVPGHDPLVMNLYPAVPQAGEGGAVQLDQSPRTL